MNEYAAKPRTTLAPIRNTSQGGSIVIPCLTYSFGYRRNPNASSSGWDQARFAWS